MPKYNEVIWDNHTFENETVMCESLGLNRQTYDSVKRRFKGDQQRAIEYLLKKKGRRKYVKVEEVKEEVKEEEVRDLGEERFKKEGKRESANIMEEYDFE